MIVNRTINTALDI